MKPGPPLTLRTRTTISVVLLTALIGVLFSVVVYLGSDTIERYVFHENLETEAAWLSASLEKGSLPPIPKGRQFFDEMTVPESYRNLSPGYHELDLSLTEEWHLLVFDNKDRRYYLLQDGSPFEKLEAYILLLLLLALFCSLAIAFWVGRRTASQIIAPITALTDAIVQNKAPFPYQSATDEIGILSRAFSKHSEELQQYLWREQCFTGDVSHELRTPLAVILGAAEVIERQTRTQPDIQVNIKRIYRVTQEMNEQLAAMLLLSRSPETLKVMATPLVPIVQSCIERCRPLLAGKSVEIVFKDPSDISVTGNPELINSVVQNLLRNACQYTEKGVIAIALTPKALNITDTGPGLPASVAPSLFKRFSHESQHHGEGLGLSIAHRIATHLGWAMTVDSSPQGSSFMLAFPSESPGNALIQ